MKEKEKDTNFEFENEINPNESSKILPNSSLKESDNGINSNFWGDLNEIIGSCGYNWNVYKILIIYFVFYMTDGYLTNYFMNITTALQKYYNISNGLIGFISSAFFIGTILGNICMVIFENVDRLKFLVWSGVIVLITNVASSLIHSVVLFIIVRIVSGFLIGFNEIFIGNITVEYLPLKLRDFLLNSLWCGWTVGIIIFLLFCKIFCPELSYNENDTNTPQNFYMAITLGNIIILINAILYILFLRDSPRNLLYNNKKEEAGKILKEYIGRELTEEELESMRDKIANQSENKYGKDQNKLKLMFSKRYIKITIVFIFIYLLKAINYLGIYVAVPILLNDESNNDKTLNKLILFNGFDLITHIVSGILSEIPNLNKKNLIMILLSISFIIGIVAIFCQNSFYIILNISMTCFNIGLNIILVWTMEILPTSTRDFGFGVFFIFFRIGSISSQFIYIFLAKSSFVATLLTYSCINLILVVLFYLLPNTQKAELDSELNFEENEEENESKLD